MSLSCRSLLSLCLLSMSMFTVCFVSVSVCFLFVHVSLVPSLWLSCFVVHVPSVMCAFPLVVPPPSFAICNVVVFSLLRWCVGSFLFLSVLTCPSCVLVRLVIDARWCFSHEGVSRCSYICSCVVVVTCVFARDCVCVCSCVFVSTMLNLPVVVCRRRCVSLCMYLRVYVHMYVYVWMESLCVYVYVCPCQCMCLSLWLKLFLDSMCSGAVPFSVGLVVVSFMTPSAHCEKSKFFVLWEEYGRCGET